MPNISTPSSSVLSKPIEFTCTLCKCSFNVTKAEEIHAKDVREIGEQYGKPKDRQWVVCPGRGGNCNAKIEVPADRYDEVKSFGEYLVWDHSW